MANHYSPKVDAAIDRLRQCAGVLQTAERLLDRAKQELAAAEQYRIDADSEYAAAEKALANAIISEE